MKLFSRPTARAKPDFETVALAELPVLYRVAKRLAFNESDAEDLVGQALFLAARAWPEFDGRFPRSWLIRILRTEYLGQVRKKASRPEIAVDDLAEPSDEGFWEEIAWKSVGSNILEEVDKLPEDYRLAITLCDVEEMPYDEAAEALGIPQPTLRTRLFRARKILRSRLVHLSEE
ncbi:MAG: RNA polymerase sigma factor [Fimbriimonas sp.]